MLLAALALPPQWRAGLIGIAAAVVLIVAFGILDRARREAAEAALAHQAGHDPLHRSHRPGAVVARLDHQLVRATDALVEQRVVDPVEEHLEGAGHVPEVLRGRHHHQEKAGNPTVRAVVSSFGRVFVLTDETETSNMSVSSQWVVTARDAFSGIRLWTTPIRTHLR